MSDYTIAQKFIAWGPGQAGGGPEFDTFDEAAQVVIDYQTNSPSEAFGVLEYTKIIPEA